MIPRYKDIIELIKKGSTVEAQEKIIELREGALELQEENQALKGKIKELEAELETRGNLEYDSGVYWLWEEDLAGDYTVQSGPFCQRCKDVDSLLVRLQGGKNDEWNCHGCGKTTQGKNYIKPPPISFA